RVVAAFARLGLQRIRLTGGEPLLRKNLPELAARLSALPGITDLSLSTNGTQLAKYARALRAAGISRLNVSLDTLDPRRFATISGRDALPRVLSGLDVAQEEGFAPIKINMVVTDGARDRDIDAMVEFCMERHFVLRLIEVMPVGETGRRTPAVLLGPVQQRLREKFGLVDGIVAGAGPARYLVSPDGRCKLGFITPMSQHFCESCNRIRMSVDGTLYLCLGKNDRIDVRAYLRDRCSDAELDDILRNAIRRKPLKHEFNAVPEHILRFMSSTGG
ncbi:MAG TPA: GTP 3',8-cyclase MoaA, partial [Noviherbaspirillum sp.]